MLSMLEDVSGTMPKHWIIMAVCWAVTITLVVAALIDGYKLKVPNWLTFPMVMSGWVASAVFCGLTGLGWWTGLGWSLLGTAVGLGLLLPAYAIGGMGAGDVKLLAGVGAWVGVTHTFWAFVISVVVGAVIAVGMVLYRRRWRHHQSQFLGILTEILIVRNPSQLSAMAAERKSSMMLLPYGIPIAIGSIAYFAWWGMLL
ncbi:MAG TPA: A24 family peptidase [Thermoguttaceae bacterium]|nr:A24 family peptidase [Thermoguttaceae bacterium]